MMEAYAPTPKRGLTKDVYGVIRELGGLVSEDALVDYFKNEKEEKKVRVACSNLRNEGYLVWTRDRDGVWHYKIARVTHHANRQAALKKQREAKATKKVKAKTSPKVKEPAKLVIPMHWLTHAAAVIVGAGIGYAGGLL